MVDGRENYKFGVGVKGLRTLPHRLHLPCVRDAFSPPPPTYPTKHSFVPKVPLLL